MRARPQNVDPFAWSYCNDVTAFLQPRKGVTLNEDLLERLRGAVEKGKVADNGPETTLKRVSWACYVIGNAVLDVVDRELTRDLSPPDLRPTLTLNKLNAFESALREVLRTSNIDFAEHRMAGDAAQRNAEQLFGDRLVLVKRLSKRGLEYIDRARAYFQSNAPYVFAEVLGHEFFYFMIDARKTQDELVELAEKMFEVHT